MEMSQAELYAYFLTRVRANLHIVLAFSPIGEAFRDRLRKFPSLINCCAIGDTKTVRLIGRTIDCLASKDLPQTLPPAVMKRESKYAIQSLHDKMANFIALLLVPC